VVAVKVWPYVVHRYRGAMWLGPPKVSLAPLPSGRALGVVAARGLRGSSLASPGRAIALPSQSRPAGCPKEPLVFKPQAPHHS
jgi:hypothetical protein